MNNSLGSHYIIDYYNCEADNLKSVKQIEDIMNDAGTIGDFHIVESCFHQFKPYGVSGVLVLQESHFTIHTWPEKNYAAVDIFLCEYNSKLDSVIEFLEKNFKSTKKNVIFIERGKI